jgi:hypothetical protein
MTLLFCDFSYSVGEVERSDEAVKLVVARQVVPVFDLPERNLFQEWCLLFGAESRSATATRDANLIG